MELRFKTYLFLLSPFVKDLFKQLRGGMDRHHRYQGASANRAGRDLANFL